jgi:hypothetical protein
MGVVREQGPGVDKGACGLRHPTEASHERLAVRVILRDRAPLDAANNDMMEGAGGIQASLARHV